MSHAVQLTTPLAIVLTQNVSLSLSIYFPSAKVKPVHHIETEASSHWLVLVSSQLNYYVSSYAHEYNCHEVRMLAVQSTSIIRTTTSPSSFKVCQLRCCGGSVSKVCPIHINCFSSMSKSLSQLAAHVLFQRKGASLQRSEESGR